MHGRQLLYFKVIFQEGTQQAEIDEKVHISMLV